MESQNYDITLVGKVPGPLGHFLGNMCIFLYGYNTSIKNFKDDTDIVKK
jgi:hypothetical protein